jgi:hypothetical protein
MSETNAPPLDLRQSSTIRLISLILSLASRVQTPSRMSVRPDPSGMGVEEEEAEGEREEDGSDGWEVAEQEEVI